MHAARELPRQRRVDHAMTFDPGLPSEGLSHNIDAVMRLTFRPVTRMRRIVQMRFVDHIEALRGKSGAEFPVDRGCAVDGEDCLLVSGRRLTPSVTLAGSLNFACGETLDPDLVSIGLENVGEL